ncbi:MAG: ATP-binding protein [Candidatus Saccharimonadales bacterium]
MLRLTVRRQIFLLLVVVSVVPLVVANVIWLLSSQSQLRKDAAIQQQLLVKSAAQNVNYFVVDKVNAAIIHSQSTGVQNMQLAEAQSDLGSYLKQDPDLTQVQLLDSSGIQKLLVTPSSVSTKAVDMSSSDAFRVVTFLGGADYISPVRFDQHHNAFISIAVPLTSYASTQDGTSLSTSKPGLILGPTSIKGTLVVTVAMRQLWNNVLNAKLGQAGYAYVTDNQGNVIAYPDTSFAIHHPNLANVPEVKKGLAETLTPGATLPEPVPAQTLSESGVSVLSSHYRVARTNWIVVAEEPIQSVYAPVNNDIRIAAIFFGLSFLVGIMLIVLLSRSLLRPIRTLTEGADKLATGDLKYRINLSRHDEFGLLAKTFNNMAAKISADIEHLENLDKLKNEFILIASHNLRTPLSVINGYIGILRKSEASPQNSEMVVAIEKAAHKLSAFSEDLLTISSIEAGSAKLHIESLPAQALLKPLEDEFNAKATDSNIQLTWSVPSPSATVILSPVHIRSAVSNLLRNALEFTPKGGKVEVTLEVTAQNYVFTVQDSGMGIQPDEVKRLFTKFHRGTGTFRYDYDGIGIGLYLTSLIVDAHHGQINVLSQVGVGSTFSITIPVQTLPDQSSQRK